MKLIRFDRIYKNRVLQHALFWLSSYYILLRLFASSVHIVKIDYIYTALFHISLILGVYINLYLFIPKLLTRRKYLIYGIAILLLITACSEFNILFFNKLVDYILPGYYFISYYEFTDILKFIVVYIAITSLIKLAKSWFELSETNKKLIELQKQKTETELKALKGQINPHFLFNSLNGIYSLALNQSNKTPEIILKLSDILRYIIYDASDNFVDLIKEVKYIKDYIDLQELRSDKRATITVDISGDLENKKIAPLLFFPLIENSFKHGIKGETGKSFVNFKLAVHDNIIICEIENNKGITDDVETNIYKGIGLDNVRKRLQMIYPDKHSFKVSDTKDKFKVNISLNQVTDEN